VEVVLFKCQCGSEVQYAQENQRTKGKKTQNKRRKHEQNQNMLTVRDP
jgi:hypothetical protein